MGKFAPVLCAIISLETHVELAALLRAPCGHRMCPIVQKTVTQPEVESLTSWQMEQP